MNEYPYLNDKTFLKKMDKSLITSYTVKIIALNWDEDPIEEIQGKVKTANFTIDGSSSMRRTGNLTLIADQTTKRIENVNQLISMNKKIKVEIGKNNTTNSYPQYPIVWYPLGIYIIISANITHSTSDMTISLQLKDKMCLLNGQCGGVIPAATILHQISSIDENGKEIILPATMYQIIQQVVTHFGNEQLGKVIISDLETQVKQVVQWNKDIPLYIVQKGTNQYALTTSEKQYIKLLNSVAEANGYYFVVLYITDIIKQGSYVLYSDRAGEVLKKAYNMEELEEGSFLAGYVSRKKQMLPGIMLEMGQ